MNPSQSIVNRARRFSGSISILLANARSLQPSMLSPRSRRETFGAVGVHDRSDFMRMKGIVAGAMAAARSPVDVIIWNDGLPFTRLTCPVSSDQ